MNDVELIRFVNDMELRCPTCNGNVSINNIFNDTIILKHNLPIPGEKVPSSETKCTFFSSDLKKSITAFRKGETSTSVFREELIDLARKKY